MKARVYYLWRLTTFKCHAGHLKAKEDVKICPSMMVFNYLVGEGDIRRTKEFGDGP